MENYLSQLEKQLDEIKQLLRQSERNLKKLKGTPKEHINVSTRKGYTQYYLNKGKKGGKKYISVADSKIATKIIQREYELSVNKKLVEMEKRLEKFIKNYDVDDIANLYLKLPEGRKRCVVPIVMTEEDFIAEWRENHPGNQNEYPEEGQFSTNRGEKVRSKSEKIIADTLDKYGVPYEYEPLFVSNKYQSYYPDFVVLNVRTKKTYYWEHLGLVSDNDYATKNFEKILMYEKNGYIPGNNLILSLESSEYKFDVKSIEDKIKKFLL